MMCFVTIQRMLEMLNGTRQLLLHCPTSCINHRDVVNADIAGANICPCKSTDDADGTDLHGFF
jgi:hypothetical protein